MYITRIQQTPDNKSFNVIKRANNKQSKQTERTSIEYPSVKYSNIAFGAIYNVKPKKINIELEKGKLLKQITEMLETDSSDTDPFDMLYSALKTYYNNIKANLKKEISILEDLKALSLDTSLNPQQKQNRYNSLKKEITKIQKSKNTKISKPQKKNNNDEKIDYELLNKFKTAILDENFNLRKVVKEHFSELKTIKTIEELKEKYPKIYTPPRPEKIIAQKIEASLPNEFYEKLDMLFETSNSSKPAISYIVKNIQQQSSIIAKKYNLPEQKFFERIGIETNKAILTRLQKIKFPEDFTSIPTRKQIKTLQVTETDIALLAVDYDDFVTTVIKKHYLDGEKLNDIKYQFYDLIISPGQLKSSEYKFEKFPEKTKSFIKTSDTLHQAQRDYGNFDIEQFKNRLDYYANQEVANNEDILRNIIDFDSCNFTQEDITNLSKFLKNLDSVSDGEQELSEVITKIKTKEIQPQGTQKLNELERKKAEENLRKIQQETQKLNSIKHEFDDAINVLYINNLNNLAQTFSKYKPTTLNPNEIEKAQFLIDLITKNINGRKKFLNKEKVEQTLSRWDTYNQYKQNPEESKIFEKAKEFATTSDGTINIDKAGQYLNNYQIVEMYPESLEFSKSPEILEKLISKQNISREMVTQYLTKFEDYLELPKEDKTKISKILDIFDIKNSNEKILIKHIIEKDYINTDTVVPMSTKSDNDKNFVSISSKAKQQIIAKYKFPTCMEYFKSFEEALSSIATDKNSSGIKIMSGNNEGLKYKMELKIMGEDDRLFSSNNNYVFDIFSDKGLH